MKLFIVIIVLTILFLLHSNLLEKYYPYMGQLDDQYQAQHPNFDRVSAPFTYSSPEEWPFDNYDRATALVVEGVGNKPPGVEQKLCPNYY